MKKISTTIWLTLAVHVGVNCASGDTVTATPPAGYYKLVAQGASDTWLSVPLVARSAALARVASVGASTLSLSLATVPVDHAYRPVAGAVYYAQFTSGNLEGLCYPIIDSLGATLTLDTQGDTLIAHPLGSVVVGEGGDRVRIRAGWTVADLLGRTADDLLMDPVSALAPAHYESGDAVLLPDTVSLGLEKNPAATLSYVAGAGWRQRGQPDLDVGDTLVLPGVPFIVRRQSADLVTAYIIGYVMQERGVVRLPALNVGEERDVPFAWIPPDGIAIPDSSLATVISPWADAVTAGDEVMAYSYQRPGFALPAGHRYHFIGSDWFDSGIASVDLRLEAGTGYILRLRGTRPVSYWFQPSGI
jgi:uncharacterized protein (TIGR02597 family)